MAARYRTFTVLVTEVYEDDWPEVGAAILELRDSLQDACDGGLLCDRFLVANVEDGSEKFDVAWNAALTVQKTEP